MVEAVQQFGPNSVGFQLATGERRWYIVGCYLALAITKQHIAYVPLNPVANYVHILDLNNRLRVG